MNINQETTIVVLNNDLSLELEMEDMTPKKWRFYQSCRVINIQNTKLEVFLAVLTKELIRLKGKPIERKGELIIDGLISTFSILYSQFLDRKRINYTQFNFQRVFLIFSKLEQLQQYVNVYLNDSTDCLDVLPNIYMPVKDSLSWQDLLSHLESNDKDIDNFQCLNEVMNNFIPKLS